MVLCRDLQSIQTTNERENAYHVHWIGGRKMKEETNI